MKTTLLLSILLLTCCAQEPKTPVACQRNFQYCMGVYGGNPDRNFAKLCVEDMRTCKEGYGQ